MWWSQGGRNDKIAQARITLDKQGYTRVNPRPRPCVHPLTHTHSHTHTHTHTPTRTQKYAILIAFSQQQWLRERPSFLRYTYIAVNEIGKKKFSLLFLQPVRLKISL